MSRTLVVCSLVIASLARAQGPAVSVGAAGPIVVRVEPGDARTALRLSPETGGSARCAADRSACALALPPGNYSLALDHQNAFDFGDAHVDAGSIRLSRSGTLRTIYVDNSEWREAGFVTYLLSGLPLLAFAIASAVVREDDSGLADGLLAGGGMGSGLIAVLVAVGLTSIEDSALWRFD